MPCRHHDIQIFDDFRCCLACGETVFESKPQLTTSPSHESSVFHEYAPLNYALGQEIRLLVVYPGGPSEDIILDIVHVNLTDTPAYEAVSYAWATQSGDASLSQAVYCKGRRIPVTKQCEAALKCFRRRGRNRSLWVDAVCIDQSNVLERNHQVGFMGTIYSNASQVLVYLGPATNATNIVLSYLNGEAAARSSPRKDRRYPAGMDHAAREFLRLRWFDRVWVLQEVALAKLATMTAGEKTVRWTHDDCITTLLGICRTMGIQPPSALHWLPASEPHADILTVLHKSRNCSSADPRDKIFAVLGLAHQKYQDAVQVNYSLTSEEVFVKLAVHLIEDEKNLAILKYTTGEVNAPEARELPSWVPQWDVKVVCDPLPPQFTTRELDMLMSIWFPSKLLPTQDDVKQKDVELFKQILEVIPHDGPVMSTETWREWLAQWHSLRAKETPSIQPPSLIEGETMALSLTQLRAQDFHFRVTRYHTRIHCQSLLSTRFEVLPTPKWPCLRIRAHKLDTIVKDLGKHSGTQPYTLYPPLRRALDSKRLCATCEAHYIATPMCQQSPSVTQTIAKEFSQEMNCRGHDKALFQTEQGIGFAQISMYAGDGVWVLDGTSVPFVLRKVDSHYVLVGECYLYRALRCHPCICCGWDLEPWKISTEIIDIH
jgi:hypothetical protein